MEWAKIDALSWQRRSTAPYAGFNYPVWPRQLQKIHLTSRRLLNTRGFVIRSLRKRMSCRFFQHYFEILRFKFLTVRFMKYSKIPRSSSSYLRRATYVVILSKMRHLRRRLIEDAPLTSPFEARHLRRHMRRATCIVLRGRETVR